MAIESEDSK